MQNRHKALWDNCLHLIRQNVTEQQYKTWFEPIVFESYSESDATLLLQVPSAYFCEYLEQYYLRLMYWALTNSFKAKVKLNYRIVTDKAHKLTQDVEVDQPADIDVPETRARSNQSPTVLDAAPQDLNPQLDLHKTFQSFIEGDSNKLPRTVGLSIAEHPGKTTFNPFFIFGPSGCGKTHLINAIGVRCKELYPHKRVLYVSARLFQVQFTDASRRNTVNDFINFYQTIDMLIIDDVQEWATAERTVATFFHIFDHLFRLGKQIILASDRPPVDLDWLKDRMLTRFSCGLIAEMEKPNVASSTTAASTCDWPSASSSAPSRSTTTRSPSTISWRRSAAISMFPSSTCSARAASATTSWCVRSRCIWRRSTPRCPPRASASSSAAATTRRCFTAVQPLRNGSVSTRPSQPKSAASRTPSS